MVNDMGCTGCGKGPKRNNPTIMVGNVDEEPKVITEAKRGSFRQEIKTDSSPKEVAQPVITAPDQPPRPLDPFEEVKTLGFEELMSRTSQHQKQAAIEIERAFSEMTEAMRHFHILNLLSIANLENLSTSGLSPDQAIVGLKTALDRKDFSEINSLYPKLREQVERRYRELMDKKISL